MAGRGTRLGLGLVASGFLLVAGICLAGLLYETETAIPAGFPGRHVDVHGIPLRVLQEGAGRDLLMIHGSPEDFALQAAALAEAFRVTRYDRPGHGFSGDGGDYSLAYNAELAPGLIEALGLERVVVVGHSYGGSTALALGLLRSPRVAALVLVDSAIYEHLRPVAGIYRVTALPAFGLGLARLLPRSSIEAMAAEALRGEFKAGPPPPGFVELRSPLWANPKVVHALANEHTQSGAELARQSTRYPEIDRPIYFIAQRDSAPRVANAERLVRERPTTVLELVAETGHYIQFERPEAVTDLIRRAASES